MSYLYINLSGNRQMQLNPDDAIVRLQEQFPEAIILPGDQLAQQAQRAEHLLKQDEPGRDAVLKKLWWEVHNSGPAYAFYIPGNNGLRIEGVIKRYQADFQSDSSFADAMHARIVAFLRSIIPEGAAVEVSEDRDEQREVAYSS